MNWQILIHDKHRFKTRAALSILFSGKECRQKVVGCVQSFGVRGDSFCSKKKAAFGAALLTLFF